jgi:hypothetical protein
MPFVLTSTMEKRFSRRVLAMLERSLTWFPELQGLTITVGVTRTNLGSAVLLRKASETKLTIRLNVRKLSYQTIGHEFMHLSQGLARERIELRRGPATKIPSGEKQCDVWTLARSQLFCDDPPTYLRLPKEVRENWRRYARSIRSLCVAAIIRRETNRFYIRWLETEIRRLVSRRPAAGREGLQLSLPLDTET